MAARPFKIAFGDAVRRLREDQGLSQEELGRRSGLHRNHVGQIERGEMSPTIDSVQVIAGALGVRPSELIALAEGVEPGR